MSHLLDQHRRVVPVETEVGEHAEIELLEELVVKRIELVLGRCVFANFGHELEQAVEAFVGVCCMPPQKLIRPLGQSLASLAARAQANLSNCAGWVGGKGE